jgi:adenylate kinase family enzyme
MVSIPDNLRQFVKIKTTSCTSSGLEFTIQTYTVIPTNPEGKLQKKRRYSVLDDNTYLKYPELIKLIPRGLSIAYHDGKEVCRLDGLEKFDGSCPLDDDNECSTNIFNQNAADINQWTNLKVEFLEKANGKMAIFKVFKMGDNYYVLGGSKNVHIVVGITETIKESELHHNILKMFQYDAVRCTLDEILDKTIIGEYVDGQHIVHVEKPYLIYFSGPLTNINRIMPDQFTLPTPEQLQKLRYLENIEGVVVVYTNLDNGTVFRQKHKTIWYILIRVMREGLRHYNKQTSTNVIITQVFGIFKKRSNDFLALTEEDFAKWYIILKNFVLFVKQSKYDFPDLDFQNLGIGSIYHEFLEYDLSKLTEDLSITNSAKEPVYEETLETPALYSYVQTLLDCQIKTCIIMRGPTGSGKSTVTKKLGKIIPSIKIHSTDNLFMVNGKYEFDPSKLEEFHNQNFQNFKKDILDNVQGIIVDNTNILYYEYGRYIELARNNGYVTVILQCKKLEPEVLLARTTHNVPINSIIAKLKKYQFVDPMYCGIFFRPDQIQDLLPPNYTPIQKTPLHITLYYGRDQINSVECRSIMIGKEYQVTVHSFCTSKAGKSLKVSVEGPEFVNGHTNLHITLETHEGFKPVDVGTYQVETTVDINKQVNGVFGPIY